MPHGELVQSWALVFLFDSSRMSAWHIMWDGVGTLQQSCVHNITNKNFFLGFGPWHESFSGWRCYHLEGQQGGFRSMCPPKSVPRGAYFWKLLILKALLRIKIVIIFCEKKFSWYPMGIQQVLIRYHEKKMTRGIS